MLLSNTCNKLLMQPVEQVPPMHSLDFPACIPDGHMLSRTSLQTSTLFVHKQVRRQCQRPEPLNSSGAHKLILVQSQQLLAIGEQHFNVPSCRYVLQQLVHTCLQVTRCPIPHLAWDTGAERLSRTTSTWHLYSLRTLVVS